MLLVYLLLIMVIGFDASRAFVEQRTGTENYSYNLLRALSKIDRENQYIVYIRRVPRESQVLRVPQGEWSSNFHFVEIPLTRLWTQVGLAYRTWIDKLDLLFIPAHTIPIFGKPGIKTIVTIHDLGYEFLPQYHQFPQKYYLNWSTVYASKYATKLIAVSCATKNDLIKKLNCDPEKIEVIYEGVEAEKYQRKYEDAFVKNVLKKYAINGEYVLSVGTIQPRKNYINLIKAFKNLESGIPSTRLRAGKNPFNQVQGRHESRNNVIPDPDLIGNPESIKINKNSDSLQLIIVGKKGWMWEEIMKYPKKLSIEDKVRFLEYVADTELGVLYKNALCLVQTSLYEGFGLPVLEAMASGCPVIASNTSSLPEVVGEAGILVDPNNINSITDAIIKVTSEQATLQQAQGKTSDKLKRLGLERVNEFTWRKTAEKTLELFEQVIGKK